MGFPATCYYIILYCRARSAAAQIRNNPHLFHRPVNIAGHTIIWTFHSPQADDLDVEDFISVLCMGYKQKTAHFRGWYMWAIPVFLGRPTYCDRSTAEEVPLALAVASVRWTVTGAKKPRSFDRGCYVGITYLSG